MKRLALSFAAGLCFSLIALEARATASEQWTSVRSENFTLVGNASESEIREVAVKLEQYRRILSRLFGTAEPRQTVPTTVIVFKNDEAFKPFGPVYRGRVTDVAGYFQPGHDLNYIAISAERKGDSSFGTIFHEFVHLFLNNHLPGLPLCFSEGLAEYYGAITASDDARKIVLGKVSPQRSRLLSERELLPLKTLLSTDYNSEHYNKGDQRSLFYAQSWALVHYLMQRDGQDGLKRFSQVLNLMSEGSTIEDSLKQVFQIAVAGIEIGLRAYVRNPPYRTNVIAFDRSIKVEKEMHSSLVSVAQSRAYLGDLLVHMNRLEEGERYLQEALALNPELPIAQASLGMLRVKQGRLQDAIQILRRAAVNDSQNYLTQYYFAYALSREGMDKNEKVWGYPVSSAAEISYALSRAIELSPQFVEAYRLQAFVNLVRNEQVEKAESMLKRALDLSSGRQDILLILAQVHMRQLKFDAAREDLNCIVQRPADPKFRDQAYALLDDIKLAESQAARLENLARNDDKGAKNQSLISEPSLQQQAHAAKQTLEKRFNGERIRGLLTDIECMERGVALSVKVGERTLRLHAAELRSVFFVTYVTGLERTVTCGARAAQNLVVLTYRSSRDPRAKFDGEAIAIEFVPEDIVIEP